MNPPVKHNGHEIHTLGRLWFRVTSNSRSGLDHFVDLEPSLDWKFATICCCEAWKYGARPCRHIAACVFAISGWLEIPEVHREEWCDRMTYLLGMRKTFFEALTSPSLTSLKTP